MKGSAKIVIVLGGVVLVLIAVLFFGSKTLAHFEKVTLNKPGVVLDSNVETVQFNKGDLLYRMWNDEEILATSTHAQKSQILSDNMLFFEDDDILFTSEFIVVDTNGLTEKTENRVVYKRNNEGSYTANDSTITENSIVKLAKRMYFLNATAKVYFGNEEVTTVDRPLLLIDKTGSVIVYDVPTKKRYLGHLTLVINEKKRFDVSDEKYYVDDRVIDLSSFGGTDNKKLVLETSSSNEEKKDIKSSSTKKEKNTENSLSVERNYSSESSVSGVDNSNGQDSSIVSGKSLGSNENNNNSVDNNEKTNSNVTQGSSHSGSFVTVKDYQALLDKINELNKKSEKAIPVLTLNYINPEVTNVTYNYQFIDVDQTLVGSPKVELIKKESDEVVDTNYISPTASVETFTGLVPNTIYYLRFIYQYDLGKGEGVQTLEVKSNQFETTKVEGVYQLKNVTSNTMVIKASLDQQMSDLSRVRLKVTSEEGATFSIEANTNLISNGGQEFTILDLLPETKYQYQLELFLTSGESLLLKESNQYQTLAGTKLNELTTSVNENNLIEVSYDWNSVEYQLQDVFLKLISTTGYTIPYRVVGQSEEKMTVVPLIEGDYTAFSVQLNLNVLEAESNKSRVLTYDDDAVISYRKNASSFIRQQAVELSTFGLAFNSNMGSLFRESKQLGKTTKENKHTDSEISTENSIQTSETTDTEPVSEVEDAYVLDEQSDKYICTLQWKTPTKTEYSVITERKAKQQNLVVLTDILSQEEKWQVFDSQLIAVSENNILEMELEISKLCVDTFEFRQAIYDNKGTLIMYVYSEE